MKRSVLADRVLHGLRKHALIGRGGRVVVALSGGYTREEANEKLARNHGMVASVSRAVAGTTGNRASLTLHLT